MKRSLFAAVQAAVTALLVTSAALLPAHGALAQAPAEPESSAQYTELIRTALAEMDAQSYLEARALFLKAHALQPSARTERALGNVEFELRRYTLAAKYFRAALASEVRPLDPAMRQQVEAALVRAESYTARVQLRLLPAGGVLSVDGELATLEPDGSLSLNVGDHDVSYDAEGYAPQRRAFSIAGGEKLEAAFELAPDAVVAGPDAAVTTEGATESATASEGGVLSKWWFWTAAGVFVVASVAAGVAVASSGDDGSQAVEGNLGKNEALLRWAP
jgi:tetratricopeptide (TPR) repeat protein